MACQYYKFKGIKAAYIYVCDICNFRCNICHLPSRKHNQFAPVKVIKQRIKKALDLGLDNLIFIGQEVILHPDIDGIIDYSFERQANYVTFNTNGLAFTNDSLWSKLERTKKRLNKVYIAVSINSYSPQTFQVWSGHKGTLFKSWSYGIKKAMSSYLNISSVDFILKRDVNISKLLGFINEIKINKVGYGGRLKLRVIDLLPFRLVRGGTYVRLKYKLTDLVRIIPKIQKSYRGIIQFEGFPVCAHNQEALKNEKYYIYNFALEFSANLPTQYDPSIYETYYEGEIENWLIGQNNLRSAYKKMFCYLDECKGCYYKSQCYGIQREYLKFSSARNVNKEICSLKLKNWK